MRGPTLAFAPGGGFHRFGGMEIEMSFRSILKGSVRAAWRCLPKSRRVPLALAVIRQIDADEQRSLGIASLSAGLSLLRENGFAPDLIVDVGAHHGDWTAEARRVFPSARYFLVDADPANAPVLERACGALPNCRFAITLLGPESRENVRFYQMGTGSSVLSERTAYGRKELTLPMTTLDRLLDGGPGRSVLLKLDVHGYELEVLRGATQVLATTQAVIMECSLIQYNEGAPLFAEVVAFMKDRGFVVYDFCGQLRREGDGVLFQTDVVFAREDSVFRSPFIGWVPQNSPGRGKAPSQKT
jgi:FkbM family methyltransferase